LDRALPLGRSAPLGLAVQGPARCVDPAVQLRGACSGGDVARVLRSGVAAAGMREGELPGSQVLAQRGLRLGELVLGTCHGTQCTEKQFTVRRLLARRSIHRTFTLRSPDCSILADVARLSQVFVPQDREFFVLFEEAAGNLVKAAELLDEMLADYPERKHLAREIKAVENDGDRITHDILHRLNQTFVTPIDREDILQLASALDDVVDLTEEAADLLVLYKIEAAMDQAGVLARILLDACRQIAQGMPRLRSFDSISHYVVEIHRLENEGDRVSREAVASLFETGIDPMVVIRWKDVFDRLEGAIDATERVADVLESVIIKNA
jgi:predicted phosphate transport protein (TIGR00153 family)